MALGWFPNANYLELAEETGVLLIEDVFTSVISDDALRADRIPPNRVLAEGYLQALRASGLYQ